MNANAARLAELEAELAPHGDEPAPQKLAGQIRLDAARAALSALDNATPFATDVPVVSVGDIVHVMDDRGITIMQSKDIFDSPAVTYYRGDTFAVTEAMLDASRDRHGNLTWPLLVNDESQQIAQWGRVRLRPGAAPSDLESWTYGTAEWRTAREQARQAAWTIADAQQRAEALQAVKTRFGEAPTTSTLMNEAPDPSIAAAEDQRRRLDATGPKTYSTFAPTERGGSER